MCIYKHIFVYLQIYKNMQQQLIWKRARKSKGQFDGLVGRKGRRKCIIISKQKI